MSDQERAQRMQFLNIQRCAEAMELLYQTYIIVEPVAAARGEAIQAINRMILGLGGADTIAKFEAVPWSARMRESGESELVKLAEEVADDIAKRPSSSEQQEDLSGPRQDFERSVYAKCDAEDRAAGCKEKVQPTPRTDAELLRYYAARIPNNEREWKAHQLATADYIGQLERELADANAAASFFVRDEPNITPRQAMVRQASEIERLKTAQSATPTITAAMVDCLADSFWPGDWRETALATQIRLECRDTLAEVLALASGSQSGAIDGRSK